MNLLEKISGIIEGVLGILDEIFDFVFVASILILAGIIYLIISVILDYI